MWKILEFACIHRVTCWDFKEEQRILFPCNYPLAYSRLKENEALWPDRAGMGMLALTLTTPLDGMAYLDCALATPWHDQRAHSLPCWGYYEEGKGHDNHVFNSWFNKSLLFLPKRAGQYKVPGQGKVGPSIRPQLLHLFMPALTNKPISSRGDAGLHVKIYFHDVLPHQTSHCPSCIKLAQDQIPKEKPKSKI